MLQLGDKIRSLWNGGAEAAGAEGLTAAIADLERQASEARTELATIPAERQRLLLADDQRGLDRLDLRETELYRTVEQRTAAIPKIRQRLNELQALEKKAAVARHRANTEAHFAALESAVRGAINANAAAKAAREAARRELGDGVTNMVIPEIYYPGFLTELAFNTWHAWGVDALAKSPREWPRPVEIVSRPNIVTPEPKVWPPLVKAHQAEVIILHDYRNGPAELWPAGHRVSVHVDAARRLVLAGHARYVAEESADRPAASMSTKPRRRAAIHDEPREGCRQVVLLRDGYEAPDGRQLQLGDIVSLPEAIATQVVRNSAGEYHTAEGVSAS